MKMWENLAMATTLSVRSGSSFTVEFTHEDSDGFLIDTSGWTATFQMRMVQPPGRIFLDTQAYTGPLPAPDETVLTEIEPGRWEVFLGKTLTSRMAPTVVFELEISNDLNPEEVKTIASGVFKVSPEVVI